MNPNAPVTLFCWAIWIAIAALLITAANAEERLDRIDEIDTELVDLWEAERKDQQDADNIALQRAALAARTSAQTTRTLFAVYQMLKDASEELVIPPVIDPPITEPPIDPDPPVIEPPVVEPPVAGEVFDGQTDLVIANANYTTPITLKDCVRVTVKESRLNSVVVKGGTDILIEHNAFFNSAGNAVSADGTDGIKVLDNYMERPASGIYAHRSKRVEFVGNTVIDVQGPMPRGQMAQFDKCTGPGLRIADNYARNAFNASTPEDMISLYRCEGTVASPILVENNYLEGDPIKGGEGKSDSGSAIMLGDGGGKHQLCRNNTIISPGQVGIGIAGGESITVDANTVYGIQSDISNVGIYAWDQSGDGGQVTITNNKIDWTNDQGKSNDLWVADESVVTEQGNDFSQIDVDTIRREPGEASGSGPDLPAEGVIEVTTAQQLINAAGTAQRGETILVTASFRLDETITLKDGVTIRGKNLPMIECSTGFFYKRDGGNDITFDGLWLKAIGREQNRKSFNGVHFLEKAKNITVANCRIEGFTFNLNFFTNNNNERLKNVLIENNFIRNAWGISGSSHSSGILAKGIDGLLIRNNIWDRNGWNPDVSGAHATDKNHNLYLQETKGSVLSSTGVEVYGNLIANGSATGIQYRCEGKLYDNVLYKNPIATSFTGDVARDNVVIGAGNIDTLKRGEGFHVNGGNGPTTLLRNVIWDKSPGTMKYMAGITVDGELGDARVTLRDNKIGKWPRRPEDGKELIDKSNGGKVVSDNTIEITEFPGIAGFVAEIEAGLKSGEFDAADFVQRAQQAVGMN